MERNEVLGHWTCEQGGRAEVMQTKKRGRHFYTRCDCCGLNQGTGQKRQQRIFDEAEFSDRAALVIPSNVEVGNVIPDKSEPVPKPEPADFDPTEPEPESEPSGVTSGAVGFKKFIPGAVLLLAAGVGVWMN